MWKAMIHSVPSIRIRTLRHKPFNPDGDFVLYWMIANRRIHYNFSLQRAVERAMELNKPIVIIEPLRTYLGSRNFFISGANRTLFFSRSL